MPTYEFDENNSGGSWWLNRDQYEALFANGWHYEPRGDKRYDEEPFVPGEQEKVVPYGWRHRITGEFNSLRDAVKNFELFTGEDFFALGCSCCGPPFSIRGKDTDEWIDSWDERIS